VAAASPERAQRLFFALWPDESARAALAAAVARTVRRSGGRPVPAGNLHVTLAFLGTVPQPRLSELHQLACAQAAAFARAQPIALCFERLVHWSRPQVLCALAGEEPSASALATALKDASAAAGFNPDLKPFQAHVTVARKVLHARALPVLSPVLWEFAAFALVDSRTHPEGPVYSVVESYSLVASENARE
jgi:2'-5' RNA ligase